MTDKQFELVVWIAKIFLLCALILATTSVIVTQIKIYNQEEAPVPEVIVTVPTEQDDLRSYAREQAELLDVNPDKFMRLINCESEWDPKAKNPVSSARGLLQYLIDTWKLPDLIIKAILDLIHMHLFVKQY